MPDHQMDELAKAWTDWGLEIKKRTSELELKGDLQEALDLTLQAKAIMTNNFPSFLDTSPGTGNSGRLNPLPIAQQQQQQTNNNGNGAAMNGIPMAAGQQADVNFLFQKLVELSEVLKDNREKTAGIIAGAEELAVSNSARVCETLYSTRIYCCAHALAIAKPLSLN